MAEIHRRTAAVALPFSSLPRFGAIWPFLRILVEKRPFFQHICHKADLLIVLPLPKSFMTKALLGLIPDHLVARQSVTTISRVTAGLVGC